MLFGGQTRAIRTFLVLSFIAIATLAILGGTQSRGTLSVAQVDKKWILAELGVIITFYFGSKAVEAYVDSRAKSKAIEKATTAEEAMKVYREE